MLLLKYYFLAIFSRIRVSADLYRLYMVESSSISIYSKNISSNKKSKLIQRTATTVVLLSTLTRPPVQFYSSIMEIEIALSMIKYAVCQMIFAKHRAPLQWRYSIINLKGHSMIKSRTLTMVDSSFYR